MGAGSRLVSMGVVGALVVGGEVEAGVVILGWDLR